MTVFLHELRQGKKSLIIWTFSITFFVIMCIFMFPEMKSEMTDVSDMFASMGSFTQAFGMDRLNFGEFLGFYSIECGNIIGIGGAFFAALLGISSLAKEEKEHTAEFLLTHPVSRIKIVTGKLCAVMTQLIVMNAVILLFTVISVFAVGEDPEWGELLLIHLAYMLMQIEIAGICFCVSAFIRHSGLGIGLGIAALAYFLSIVANISDSVKTLKYVTPFGYTEGADIITEGALDGTLVGIGIAVTVLCLAGAFVKYRKKDIL